MKKILYCFCFVALLGLQGCRKASTRDRISITSLRTENVSEVQNNGRSKFLKDKEYSATEIFKRYDSAVFMVFTTDGYNAYQGSGFFISRDGLAVSNYHVFKGTGVGYEIIKLSDGRQYKIEKVLAKSEADDYILFRVKGQFNYIPVSQRKCEVGERVYTIGSPKGLENTFSSGEISQIREGNFIQISCPIDHGSSGGVLINRYGEAIGITTGGRDDSGANLNFAKDICVVPYQTQQ